MMELTPLQAAVLIPDTLSVVLTEKYRLMADWMNANKLVNNADKTHLMVMGS